MLEPCGRRRHQLNETCRTSEPLRKSMANFNILDALIGRGVCYWVCVHPRGQIVCKQRYLHVAKRNQLAVNPNWHHFVQTRVLYAMVVAPFGTEAGSSSIYDWPS